jgi:hypothetical protein
LTDFGWNGLEQMKVAGFSDASVDTYISAEFGQLVFKFLKGRDV